MISRTLVSFLAALAASIAVVAEDRDQEAPGPLDETLAAEVVSGERLTGDDEATDADAADANEAVEEPTEETGTAGDQSEPPVAPDQPDLLEEAPQADPAPGLAVRVEKLRAGEQTIDPAQVRVMAPFPAKLLAQTPPGWRIETSASAPPFTREVELAAGKSISLTVRPHVLMPDADATEVFSIPEPGYAAPLGYRQDATVGAIISNSIRQLDKDARELGEAIEQLQQLLVSLPRMEESPDASEPRPANLRPQ
jgi:hypothetical protein